MFKLILLLNAIWIALGFHLFALRNKIFAKILVPKTHRESPVFDTLAATGPFLGGFNFAFWALNVLIFITDFVLMVANFVLVGIYAW